MNGYEKYWDASSRTVAPWPLVASSLWLRLAFIAGGGAVAALAVLLKDGSNPLWPLAWLVGCAWLAVYAWRRAIIMLDRLDAETSAGETAPAEASPARATHAAWDRREARIATEARG